MSTISFAYAIARLTCTSHPASTSKSFRTSVNGMWWNRMSTSPSYTHFQLCRVVRRVSHGLSGKPQTSMYAAYLLLTAMISPSSIRSATRRHSTTRLGLASAGVTRFLAVRPRSTFGWTACYNVSVERKCQCILCLTHTYSGGPGNVQCCILDGQG